MGPMHVLYPRVRRFASNPFLEVVFGPGQVRRALQLRSLHRGRDVTGEVQVDELLSHQIWAPTCLYALPVAGIDSLAVLEQRHERGVNCRTGGVHSLADHGVTLHRPPPTPAPHAPRAPRACPRTLP